MGPDEIGGSCPRCDAEFRPGITVCPDCGIPLLGADEAAPAPPAAEAVEPPPLAVPPEWADRLTLIAAACDLAVALVVAGAAVSAFALGSGFGVSVNRYQRITYVTRAASPGVALVVVVAALAVALTGRLRTRTSMDTAVQRATFGSAALLLVLAVVGTYEEWRGNPSSPGWQTRAWTGSSWLAVGILVTAAGWISGVLPGRSAGEQVT